MAQCRVHYRTYNHADNEAAAAELVFVDAAGAEVPHKKSEGAEGYTVATFADAAERSTLRVMCKSPEWKLRYDPCYVPCIRDCKLEIALLRVEMEIARVIYEESRTEIAVELEWCETVDGEHREYGHASAPSVTIQDSEGECKESKPAMHGKAKFVVPRGRWYTVTASELVMCPGAPWIFACGDEELCLKVCCRPAQLLELVFEDQCGHKLPHAECFIDNRKARANEHGILWYVPSGGAPISLTPRGDRWTFSPTTVDMTGQRRKAQSILCNHVPAPAKATWVIISIQLANPTSLIAILRPVGGRKEDEVVLEFDSSGHAEKDFGIPGTYMFSLIEKAGGALLYMDTVTTEVKEPPVLAAATPRIAAAHASAALA